MAVFRNASTWALPGAHTRRMRQETQHINPEPNSPWKTKTLKQEAFKTRASDALRGA